MNIFWFILILLAAALIVYFVPTLIAYARRREDRAFIFVLNLFLGWTFIGWIAAFYWATWRRKINIGYNYRIMANEEGCAHADQIDENVKPHSEGCEECEKTGDTWVKVRLCMTCGHTGCCDSSKNTHARKHFEATGHPIIDSYQPPHEWRWCYIDDRYISNEK